MKKFLSILIACIMVLSMLTVSTLSVSALEANDKIKEVALTLTEPVAGDTVNLDVSSVEVEHFMSYRVVGLNWYKNHEADHLGIGSADKYFIGGESYTVRVDLEHKAGNSGWNFNYQGTNTDYSGIHATINGKDATVTYREINPDSKTISVMYTFENIPEKYIVPGVYIPQPIAGETHPSIEKITVSNARGIKLMDADYNWYKYTVSDGSGSNWKWMDTDEKFVAGNDYRVAITLYATQGFRFNTEKAHMLGEDKYIFGYVNGKQMSMKLLYMGMNDEGKVYSDVIASFVYDFVSCEAQVLNSVSFDGIQLPSEGQHPTYNAPTMGSENYSLVTDDAISGGAEYGFVNGISWSNTSGHLNPDSVFEKGGIYTLSFFIKSAGEIYRFADWMEATANEGYVEVITLDDPTLALVNIEFAPCEGGVLHEINISDVEEPMTGKHPDYNFTYSQGFDKGNFAGDIVWYDVTDEKELLPSDTFAYGHEYEVRLILRSDKQIYGAEGKFEFAPHASLTVNVNGKSVDSIAKYDDNPEENWVKAAIKYACAKAPVTEITVEIENPVEGNKPAQQIALKDDTYQVVGFYFLDSDTDAALKADDLFGAGKTYYLTVGLSPAEGYFFDGSITATINTQKANVFIQAEDGIVFGIYLVSDERPYYMVGFDPGEGTGTSYTIKVKNGSFVLPECEYTAPEGKKFAGWTTDGGMTLVAGEYVLTDNPTFTAFYIDINSHQHVYSDAYWRADELFHYRKCISEDCNYDVDYEISEMHDWGNNTNCDATCTKCGYERTTNQAGEPLHFYTHECSEVCPNCGLQRVTEHTPGAAATCTEAQKCTVCEKVLVEKLGHTPGTEADCGHDQTCTVCGDVLVEASGNHTPGAGATCTEPQKCTVCQAVLAEATGHVAGVEWIIDENGHHKICTCGVKVEEGTHTDADGNARCDVCDYNLSTGLSVGAIIGIVAGSVALIGSCGFCVYWFVIRKRFAAKK